MANVFQEPTVPVVPKLPYRGKPSFASMVAMAQRAASQQSTGQSPDGEVAKGVPAPDTVGSSV